VVKLAIDSFKASKVRFLLTMLGMIIGSASIILVYTLGLTGKDYALKLISSSSYRALLPRLLCG
jgi:putative ABC transport system permease protein